MARAPAPAASPGLLAGRAAGRPSGSRVGRESRGGQATRNAVLLGGRVAHGSDGRAAAARRQGTPCCWAAEWLTGRTGEPRRPGDKERRAAGRPSGSRVGRESRGGQATRNGMMLCEIGSV